MGLRITGSSSDPIPAGGYTAKLTGIVLKPAMKFGDALEWQFGIVDSNHPQLFGMNVTGMSSTKATPQSKLTSWLNSGFGISVEPGDEFDTDEIIGRIVRIRVKETQQPSNRNDGTMVTFSNVDALATYNPQNPKHGQVMTAPANSPQAQPQQQQPPQQGPPPQQTNISAGGTAQQPLDQNVQPPPQQATNEFSKDDDVDF